MAQLTCELCNGTDFVKQGGVFVCQKCGCKYSLEDAQRLMAAAENAEKAAARAAGAARHRIDPDAPRPVAAHAATAPAEQPSTPSHFDRIASVARHAAVDAAREAAAEMRIDSLADFDPLGVNAGVADARTVNNYVCQGWQLLLAEYGKFEHPTKEQQESLAARARECLTLLDNVAMVAPADHVRALLIYENCREIVKSARATKYYEPNKNGGYFSWSMPSTVKLSLPGQSASWDQKAAAHRAPIEAEYTAAHPDEIDYRAALNAQKDKLESELADLKDEKRSHGLFDFAGKREVKDRMAPVKDQIADIEKQLRNLDGKVAGYVSNRLAESSAGWVRLDF